MNELYSAIAASSLLSLLPMFVGCSGRLAASGDTADDTDVDSVLVETLKPERVELSRTIRQPATIHADQQANIYSKASGYLSEVNADIGAKVSKNDPLAIISVPEMERQRSRQAANVKRLEAEEKRAAAEVKVAKASADKARANVKKAQAKLTAAVSEYNRIAGLVKQRAVADRLLDEATEKHEAAKAEKAASEEDVKLADANIELSEESAKAAAEMTKVANHELEELDELVKYATLSAPFDGVVLARNVDEGDLVRNTQSSAKDGPPLYVVAKTDPVRARVSVPERETIYIKIGQEVHVTLQAMSGQPIKATVSRKAGGLDESTRTMLVEIDLPNPDGRLLPGMFGEATITTEENKSRLILPANVVRYDEQGKSYVYVVNSSKEIQVVDVKTGFDDGQRIEITEGLTGDENVVAPMLGRLKQGQKVRVVE